MDIHHKNFSAKDLLLAIIGFVLHLTAGCLIIHAWKQVPTDRPNPASDYRGKGLGLGSILIMQSFVMLAEAGLQALNLKSQ